MIRLLFIITSCTLLGCSDAKWETPHTAQASAADIKVATFNLKFYGSGGGFYQKGVEPRKAYLTSFITQELADRDVVLFSEVVDVPMLQKELKSLWDCVSYNDDLKRKGWHQHLVLCYKPNLYRVEKYDDDFVIPEHALGSRGLRPALQAKLCLREGPCVLQILGVHLKAGRKTDTRILQMQAIVDNFNQRSRTLPTLLTGDFNSYSKERSGHDKDDIEIFEDLLSTTGKTYKSLTKGISTFGSGAYGRDYDHFVASQEISASEVTAYGACDKNLDPNQSVIPYPSFKRNFSDHCYVKATLHL